MYDDDEVLLGTVFKRKPRQSILLKHNYSDVAF